MNKILLIGGTDPSGAGLQTDLQVVHHLQTQASSVVTAVTSQNEEGVLDQGVLLYQQVKSQLRMFKNTSFSSIKIGMLGNESVVKAIVHFIKKQPTSTSIILDPVLSSSAGGILLNRKGIKALLKDLLPFVTLITPNTDELEILSGQSINSHEELELAASRLLKLGAKAVLVKGGHFQTNEQFSTDFFISHSDRFYLKGQRWENRQNVRGTGCAFATAVASTLSKGYSLSDAIVFSKALISNGIQHAEQVEQQLKLSFKPYINPSSKTNPFDLSNYPKLYKSTDELFTENKYASCDTKNLGIYPVVDSIEWLKKLVPLGIKTIQLRIKDKLPEYVETELREAIQFARENNTRLFINDYWQLAIKHQAYGIHLGQEDIDKLDDVDLNAIANSGCRLGVSTHCYTEVARAHAIKPSYLALGPIFETTSKIMPWIPQGVPAVQNWVDLLGEEYPLVAIGGIDMKKATDLKKTDVGSVAMISAITEAKDYSSATCELITMWDKT